jgi:hypothetical protein
MTRIKMALLGLLAVLSASALAAGQASALENKYFEQPKTEITSSAVEGTVGTAWLQSEIAGQKIEIESVTNKFEEGKIEKEGKSSGKIKFEKPVLFTVKEGLSSTTAATCTVEPIEFKFKDKLFTQTKAGVVADEFEPSTGKIFIEIKIVSVTGKTCLLKGTFAVEGTYTAALGGQGEEDKVEHELIFDEGGSSVTFAKTAASFTNIVKIKQTNGKEFYMD